MALLPSICRHPGSSGLVTRREDILQGSTIPWRQRDHSRSAGAYNMELLDANCEKAGLDTERHNPWNKEPVICG